MSIADVAMRRANIESSPVFEFFYKINEVRISRSDQN